MSRNPKSNIAITQVRTGHGDTGSTKLAGNKPYRKGHALVRYSAALDIAQGYTSELPDIAVDQRYSPRLILQEVLFRLGAAIGSRNPGGQTLPLTELSKFMARDVEIISKQLAPLDSFLRTTPNNAGLQRLRGVIRKAESACVEAYDFIVVEDRDTSPGVIKALELSMQVLNVASDFVFAWMWLVSTTAKGNVEQSAKWVPMDDATILTLNEKDDLERMESEV